MSEIKKLEECIKELEKSERMSSTADGGCPLTREGNTAMDNMSTSRSVSVYLYHDWIDFCYIKCMLNVHRWKVYRWHPMEL